MDDAQDTSQVTNDPIEAHHIGFSTYLHTMTESQQTPHHTKTIHQKNYIV